MLLFLLVLPLILTTIGTNCDDGDQFRLNVLNTHNRLRSELATGSLKLKDGTTMPPATNIVKLYWSPKLEKKSQNYANSCPKNHSMEMINGENLFNHYSTHLKTKEEYATLSAEAWWNEFNIYGWKEIMFEGNEMSGNIGHATQMAWHSTELIGCGFNSNCKNADGTPFAVVVCQYFPGGNVIQAAAYEKGETCSNCPANFKFCKYGLCSLEKAEEEE